MGGILQEPDVGSSEGYRLQNLTSPGLPLFSTIVPIGNPFCGVFEVDFNRHAACTRSQVVTQVIHQNQVNCRFSKVLRDVVVRLSAQHTFPEPERSSKFDFLNICRTASPFLRI